MAPPYSSSKSSSSRSSFTYPPRYYPDYSTSPLDDFRALVAQAVRALARFWRERGRRMLAATTFSAAYRMRLNLTYNRLVSFPHLLVAVWVFVLLWGERWAFHSKVESCHWSNWEHWVCRANSRALKGGAYANLGSYPHSPPAHNHTASPSSPTRSSSTRTRIPAARGRSTR